VLAEADAVGVPLPVISAANEQYIRARAQGYGDADFSAVLEAVTPQEKELSA
jgi:glyoxylate/succinic semialdehyde reductase